MDICPCNICPCDICPYQEYLSCHWPDFHQTLNLFSKLLPIHSGQYKTIVKWTFVHATFVHIRNISAVTSRYSISTKKNLSQKKISPKKIAKKNIYQKIAKKMFTKKKFWQKVVFWQNYILRKKKFWQKVFFGHNYILRKKKFCPPKNFANKKFVIRSFFFLMASLNANCVSLGWALAQPNLFDCKLEFSMQPLFTKIWWFKGYSQPLTSHPQIFLHSLLLIFFWD